MGLGKKLALKLSQGIFPIHTISFLRDKLAVSQYKNKNFTLESAAETKSPTLSSL